MEQAEQAGKGKFKRFKRTKEQKNKRTKEQKNEKVIGRRWTLVVMRMIIRIGAAQTMLIGRPKVDPCSHEDDPKDWCSTNNVDFCLSCHMKGYYYR